VFRPEAFSNIIDNHSANARMADIGSIAQPAVRDID